MNAETWLASEEAACRDGRIARLEWLANRQPPGEAGFLISGGWLSVQLMEEAKYCFAYGQFLATAILGVAFVERTLAARLYGSGRDDLERASGAVLLGEALRAGWISQDDFERFDSVRQLRNPIVHFRKPLAPGTLERRAMTDGRQPEALSEEDAKQIMESVFRVLANSAV